MLNQVRRFTFAFVFFIAACGGGGEQAPTPGLLAGQASGRAQDALLDVEPIAVPRAERAGDLLLSRLSATLTNDATVAQFNAAARAVGATGIAFARRGSPFVTLSVPPQNDGAALARLADTLRSQPGVAFATPGRQLARKWLPGQSIGAPQAPDQLKQLLPARFPAAWNVAFSENGQRSPTAQRCTATPAHVVIVDLFQSQSVGAVSELGAFVSAQRYGAFQAGADDHGWQVAAIMASTFDELLPTGAVPLPECVDFTLVDVTGVSYEGAMDLLQRAIASSSAGRSIVLSATGFGTAFCGPNANDVCTAAAVEATPPPRLMGEMTYRLLAAAKWAECANAALEDRVLLVQAAGNEAAASPDNGGLGLLFSGIRQADLASPMALATRLNQLPQLFAPTSATARDLWTGTTTRSLLLDASSYQVVSDQVARLAYMPGRGNLLLVGSVSEGDLASSLVVSAFSNNGASVFAVGEGVVGLDGHILDGTSFASPQVAGLAAYLWSISTLDRLPTSDTAKLIHGTLTSNRIIDAYAALLALDATAPGMNAAIRLALMDVNGDGIFDEQDVDRFRTAYGLGNPGTPTLPSARDYGRFDLNGDGATGGISIAPFDLDFGPPGTSGAPVIGSVDLIVEGYEVSFNEAALSDVQILCYYAYSSLFAAGSPTPAQVAARSAWLGADICVGARLNALLPAQVSGSAPLAVTVEVPAGPGAFAPAPDVYVSLAPTCGTVGAASGRTDAAGKFTTSVSPSAGCATVTVAVEARANPGSPLLAHGAVSASVLPSLAGVWRLKFWTLTGELAYCWPGISGATASVTFTQSGDQLTGTWNSTHMCGIGTVMSGTMSARVGRNERNEPTLIDWQMSDDVGSCLFYRAPLTATGATRVGTQLGSQTANAEMIPAPATLGNPCPNDWTLFVSITR